MAKKKFKPYWNVIQENLAGYGANPTVWIDSEEKELKDER